MIFQRSCRPAAPVPELPPLPARLTLSSAAFFREVDGEGVLLDTARSRYYGLDEAGTRIWQLLAEEQSLESIYHTLLADYEVEPLQLARDLHEFVTELARMGLATRE